MRFLFTFAGGRGHLDPLLPLARAAEVAGHEIVFVARPWMVPIVRSLGFEAWAAGSDEGLAPVTRELVPFDAEREQRALRDGFVGRIARERAPDLHALVADRPPDLIVWEETDFGAPIVAERLGLPHASVLVIASGSFVRADLLAPTLDDVRREHGLSADPEAAMLRRYLVFSPFPTSLRDPGSPPPAMVHGLGPGGGSRAAEVGAPPWARTIPGAPTIYVTLGTVFNHELGDLFARILTGLGPLRANVLVTVGREIDPASVGPQPPNVRVERFVPQDEILPFVDVVVSHAGSGSVLGALMFGRPMVLLPIGADQPLNAERCAALGVGQVLDAVSTTPTEVAAAVISILADPAYRATAGRLRDEIAALPAPEAAVPLLERLARERRPIPSMV